MDYIDCNNLDHAILFLDFKKAFDSVSHQFLFHLLKCLGLPQEFIYWVQIMYTSAFSVVHHNNWLTPSIPLGHGVQQGCPLSYHLFNLVGQVLIYSLHHSNFFDWWTYISDFCSLYADDTSIFSRDIDQIPGLIHHIQ